jgi:pilus assembly protein FimV
MLVGVILLLGAGVWMFLRRRREADESEFDMPFDQESAAPVEIKLPTSTRRVAPAVEEPMPDSGLDFGNAGGGYQSAGLETLETDESEIDPIAEADVYLAYRRFQQAEDLIRDALKREPQREELHLKMLEIYFGSGNKEGFEAQAEALYAILGGAETDTWHKVVSMGQELCPEHPLFGSGGEPALAVSAQPSFGSRSTGAVVTAADQFAPLWQEDASANEAMDETSTESAPFAGYDDRAGKSTRAVSDDHVMNFDPAATKTGSVMKSGRDERASESSSVPRENAMDFDLSGFAFDKPANNGGHDDLAESHDSVAEFDFSKMDHGNFDSDLTASDDAIGKRARSEHELDTALQGLGGNLGEGEEVFTGLDDVGFGDDGDDLFSGADMVSTKLDLARAYIDMDDREGARGILSEVLEEGNNSQKQEATELMRKLG